MALIKIATIFTIDLEFETAPVYKRAIAYLIDLTILVLYFISMKNLYYGGVSYDTDYLQSHKGIDILTISLPMLLYSLVCEIAMHGQTVGKKIMNIRVISLTGGSPSLSQYFIRWMFKAYEWPFLFGYVFYTGEMLIAYIATTMMFGAFVVVLVAVTARNQRLGDLAANTVVVNTKSPYSVKDTVFMNIVEDNYEVAFPQVLRLSDRDINTVKNVISICEERHNYDMARKVADKIVTVLNIQTDMEAHQFLKKVLADYNYLGAK